MTMENEMTIYEAERAVAKVSGTGYKVKTPFGTAALERDVDFGVIPGTKSPSLFKSGAERSAWHTDCFSTTPSRAK